MNNWRLLLLAVVAVLQPIGSFTESNLIDGRQECCDHRSNSLTQDTRLYGNYRKTTPEERRLNIREDIREERRYEARSEPVTESRERLSLTRTERRISSERAVRFNDENRFARDQERRDRFSANARKSSQIREDQNHRARESDSREYLIQYERDVLDSRRIRMSKDDTRSGRVGNERLYRDTLDSRDRSTDRVRNSEDLRRVSRVSPTRDTMAVLRRERDEVARGVRRESRMTRLDNTKERHTLDRRARGNADERRSRSVDSRVNNVNEREDLRTKQNSREERQSVFKTISERVEERRQNRESRGRNSAFRLDSPEGISAIRRRESRDTVKREDGRVIRENRSNESMDERRQARDGLQGHKLSRKRSSMIRASRASADQPRPLAQESRILQATFRDERLVRSNDRTEERREVSRNIQKSRDSTTERKQDSRVSRLLDATARDDRVVRRNYRTDERREVTSILVSRDTTAELRQGSRVLRVLEATARDERLLRTDDGRNNRQQTLTRSLDRVSVLRASRDVGFVERDNSMHSARLPERNVRDLEVATYRRDVRNVERSDEQREQRDESRLSRDRTISMRRESRNSVERRQESRSAEREYKNRGNLRAGERFEGNHHEREERRASRKQAQNRMLRDNEQRRELESTRTSRFAERAFSDRHVIRDHTDIRSVRFDVHDSRDENKESRDRTVNMQRLTRDVSAPERNDIRMSRDTESNGRLQRIRTLQDIRERREVRERDDNGVSRDRTMIRRSRERIGNQRREVRRTTTDTRDNRNEVNRDRANVRMGGERLEVRRQHDESRASRDRVTLEREPRDILAARSVEQRSRGVTSRDTERNIRSERLSRSRDERRSNEREVRNRDLSAVETRRESRRMTERAMQPNRHFVAMERIDRRINGANRDMRIEAKLRSSDIIIAKDLRTDIRDIKRDAIDTRFRNFDLVRDIKPIEEASENRYAMNWQMVFYTLQGAYLCSLLMQMLTEKSNKTKTRNFTWWVFSSKDLVKVE